MEGSREEVMRVLRLVVAEFQIPDERTREAKLQDWAVNLAWGGSDELAKSGMMNPTGTTRNAAHVSKHATSVARMNDGAAGGSARSHNDD